MSPCSPTCRMPPDTSRRGIGTVWCNVTIWAQIYVTGKSTLTLEVHRRNANAEVEIQSLHVEPDWPRQRWSEWLAELQLWSVTWKTSKRKAFWALRAPPRPRKQHHPGPRGGCSWPGSETQKFGNKMRGLQSQLSLKQMIAKALKCSVRASSYPVGSWP